MKGIGGDLKSSMGFGMLLHTAVGVVLRKSVPSNNAFERPVKRFASARGQRAIHFAPSARLKARRPAAQRER